MPSSHNTTVMHRWLDWCIYARDNGLSNDKIPVPAEVLQMLATRSPQQFGIDIEKMLIAADKRGYRYPMPPLPPNASDEAVWSPDTANPETMGQSFWRGAKNAGGAQLKKGLTDILFGFLKR